MSFNKIDRNICSFQDHYRFFHYSKYTPICFIKMVTSDIVSELSRKILPFVISIVFKRDFFDELKSRIMTKNSHLYIRDGNITTNEGLFGVIGKGGSKKAIQLANGRVLIVPNFDEDSVASITRRWNRIVAEEVMMSNLLSSIGLLSPMSKKVIVSLSWGVTEPSISAYLCESFESMSKTKRLFILDNKNPNSSTWKGSLFQHPEDRADEEKWDNIVDEIIVDISKIVLHQIPVSGDSLNLAIQANGTSTLYKARFFGFDFSSKHYSLEIPETQKISQIPDREDVSYLVRILVGQLIIHEINTRDFEKMKFKTGESFNQFFDRLKSKYTDQVLALIAKELKTSSED